MKTKKNRQSADNTRSFGSQRKGCTGWQNVHFLGRSTCEHFVEWSVFSLTFSLLPCQKTLLFSLYNMTYVHLSSLSLALAVDFFMLARWKKKMHETAICFMKVTPPFNASLSHHWLAVGLASCFDQCVVSMGCLSESKEPSKPLNRIQWTWGRGVLMATWKSDGSFCCDCRMLFPKGVVTHVLSVSWLHWLDCYWHVACI